MNRIILSLTLFFMLTIPASYAIGQGHGYRGHSGGGHSYGGHNRGGHGYGGHNRGGHGYGGYHGGGHGYRNESYALPYIGYSGLVVGIGH